MIDTKRLADDCFTLANEIHDIGYEHLIEQEVEDERKDNLRLCKQLNEKRLNSFPTYARFQKLDLDTLARKLWDYSAQMKDEKYKIERDWNDPEHYLTMQQEYNHQKTFGGEGQRIGNKELMAEALWEMLEPTLPPHSTHVSYWAYQKSTLDILEALEELQQKRISSDLQHDDSYEAFREGMEEKWEDYRGDFGIDPKALLKAKLEKRKEERLKKKK